MLQIYFSVQYTNFYLACSTKEQVLFIFLIIFLIYFY